MLLFVPSVGNDENISNTWKFLSHSTDSLNKISKVNESTESLTDEGKGTLWPVSHPSVGTVCCSLNISVNGIIVTCLFLACFIIN